MLTSRWVLNLPLCGSLAIAATKWRSLTIDVFRLRCGCEISKNMGCPPSTRESDPPVSEARKTPPWRGSHVFSSTTEHRLLRAFRRAAAGAPSYRALLETHDVRAEEVIDLSSFSRLCPVLSKSTTFDRFPIDQLSVGGRLGDLADVLTSSGRSSTISAQWLPTRWILGSSTV